MIRVGRKYSVEEILPAISPPPARHGRRAPGYKPHAFIDGYRVGCTSLRLRCFKHKGVTCASCGIQAAYFVLEQTGLSASLGQPPHLNLYALDAEGQEVLMTADHIVALADGGRDSITNVQTMCSPCNRRKGSQAEHAYRALSKEEARKRCGGEHRRCAPLDPPGTPGRRWKCNFCGAEGPRGKMGPCTEVF